jgi:DNA-binding NtrC family response regulator
MSDTTIATRVLREGERAVSQLVRVYRLDARSPDGRETRHELAQQVARVGSRGGNDVVLDDETVSGIHFEILAEPQGFRLRDLDSSNGTVVDGYRTRDIYLRPGSQIVAGRTELHFVVLDREAELSLSPRNTFGRLIGSSAPMRQLFSLLERVAPTDFTVLVEGETGTGKELVARAIHDASRRADGPFVVFDAAAVPEHLAESQLFGHERGAFTGATERRVGVVEAANGGTLFIDELGELPMSLQPKLLRVLEAREICTIGSNQVRPVDVRVVAATHRDLAAAINAGEFRDDLYYRLAVVRLVVPPLRERKEDLQQLVAHFVKARHAGDPARAAELLRAVPEDNWAELRAYPWPGNVRQVRNVVEATLALLDDRDVARFDPRASGGGGRRGEDAAHAAEPDLERAFIEQRDLVVESFERAYMVGIIERHDGNISRAAAAAGLDRSYFKRLLRKYR